MDIFEKTANIIKAHWKNSISRLKAYFKKLLFPLYLFPIKLLTYSSYYIVKFVIKLILAFIGLIIDTIKYPFKSLKHFFKAVFFAGLGIYLLASFFVILIVLDNEYGTIKNFFCRNPDYQLKKSVVRIVGGYSEGSGFFIADDRVITNFHRF